MMNANICWLLVRLAALLGVLLVRFSEEATHQDFLNSHVDFPMSGGGSNLNAYCDTMMARRRLTTPTCKRTNTFINANPTSIQQVCGRGGTRWRGNLRDSRGHFHMVVCRNVGAPTHGGGCQYRGRRENRRIRLGCVNRLPVHLDRLL